MRTKPTSARKRLEFEPRCGVTGVIAAITGTNPWATPHFSFSASSLSDFQAYKARAHYTAVSGRALLLAPQCIDAYARTYAGGDAENATCECLRMSGEA